MQTQIAQVSYRVARYKTKTFCVQKKAVLDAEAKNQGTDGVDMSVLEQEFRANNEKVVNLLIDSVLKVDMTIPRVVQGKFGEEA